MRHFCKRPQDFETKDICNYIVWIQHFAIVLNPTSTPKKNFLTQNFEEQEPNQNDEWCVSFSAPNTCDTLACFPRGESSIWGNMKILYQSLFSIAFWCFFYVSWRLYPNLHKIYPQKPSPSPAGLGVPGAAPWDALPGTPPGLGIRVPRRGVDELLGMMEITPGDCWDFFRELIGMLQGFCRDFLGISQGFHRDFVGVLWAFCWDFCGDVVGNLWGCGEILGELG